MPEAATFAEIKTAVAEALESDPATEEPILRRFLGNDESALAEARRWVAASREASDLFERPLATADGLLPFQSAGPYSVIRRLGSGGMGVVYEVERDGEHFALKSIRPSMVADWSLARFRQEAAILGRLDHPSIARLVDTGLVNDLPYFVMELVDGEPVDSFVESRNLSIEDRLRLFVAVCRSVGYAHDQGFVHRDLKPNNIWVTRGGVPKLLDFGISKAVAGNTTLANSDQTLTAHRMITPAYASPEHLRGEVTGPATDVYSLGVILFEISSGRRFPAAAADETTPSVRVWNRKLDWIVRTALDPDWKKRYASASALADDVERMLAGERIQARAEGLGKWVSRMLRRHPAALSALAVVAVAAAAWTGWTRLAEHPVAAKLRPSVAIAGFVTSSGVGAGWVPEALSDALELELGATGKLRVIRGTDVDRVRAAFQKELSRGGIPQGLVAQLPADYYVTGQLQPAGEGPVRVLLQFVRRLSREVVYTETVALSRNQVPMTAYAASRGFQRTLGVLTEADVHDSQPIPYLGNPRVAELYARSLEATRDYHYKAAREAIDAAVKIDPDNPVLRLARAKALTNIGARIEARQESEQALKLAVGKLPEEQQLAIAKLDHQLHGRWDKAEGVLRRLVEIFYDDPRYAADLAHNIGIEGRHKEALEVIERFRKTMPVEAVPFWFYLVAIEEATESNEFDRAEQYGALVKKRVGPGSLELAQLLRLEARLRKAQQKPLEALALYEQAAPLAEQGGDLYTLSSCWNEMGIIHYDLNHVEQAENYYGRALDLSRKVGTRLVEGNLLNNLGLIVQQRGDLERAEQMFRDGLSAYSDVGAGGGFTVINLGNTQLLRGDYVHARATLEESMEAARKADDPMRIGWTLLYQGLLAYENYDDRKSALLYTEGWNLVKGRGPGGAFLLSRLGRELARARRVSGDLPGARTALDETVVVLEKMSAPNVLAYVLVARIPVLLELGLASASASDWARIGTLSAPGVDPVLDFEAAVLKSSIALERRWDREIAREILARGAKQTDQDEMCWSGDRVFRIALRNGDVRTAQEASNLCRGYLARTHSERERLLYRTRAALAAWAASPQGASRPPAVISVAMAQFRKRGAHGQAAEFESSIRDVVASVENRAGKFY